MATSAAAAALSNLKLTLGLLLTGLGCLGTLVAVPVLLVVLAMSAGVGRGLRLDVPAADVPALAAGQLECPVPGASVTQPWGPSDLPGEPAVFGYAHFHTGVDLGAAQGAPIHASEGGQVLQAAGQVNGLGFLVGYGNLVRIQAGRGRVDYYGHMVEFAVQRGDVVRAGQVIGYVGTTGYSTGPHLHFEVRVDGTPVDPAPFMRPC